MYTNSQTSIKQAKFLWNLLRSELVKGRSNVYTNQIDKRQEENAVIR